VYVVNCKQEILLCLFLLGIWLAF